MHLVIMCSKLIHENQMNLKFIWCHYCFHDLYDLVVAYNLFESLFGSIYLVVAQK
jgi:hypothetical protein